MTHGKERRWGCVGLLALYALAIGATAWMLVALCGCKATEYVPVETVRTEYKDADTAAIYDRLRSFFEALRSREASSDSVVERNKETVVLKENGDTARHDTERTVYKSSRRERELEHKLSQSDSTINALRLQLASVKADSIAVPYPVEKELTRWQRARLDLGTVALGGIAVALCVAVAWVIRRFRR